MKSNKQGIIKLRRLKTNAQDLVPPKQPVRSILDVFGIPQQPKKTLIFRRLKKKL